MRWVSLVSHAHEWGQVHPHRQHIIRVGVHIHGQGKLHIWCLNIVNSSAVHCLYDGPDLREWEMQRESWNLKMKTSLLVVIYDDTICWLSLDIFFQALPFNFLPCCLPAGSVTRGGAPQPRPAHHSAPVWAGTVWGWWCSSGSSGLGDEAATPWSSPSGSSQFYGERDGKCVLCGVELQPNKSTWHDVNLPVLKLCCSRFVCAPIYQLLRLKKNRFRRKYINIKKLQLNIQQFI